MDISLGETEGVFHTHLSSPIRKVPGPNAGSDRVNCSGTPVDENKSHLVENSIIVDLILSQVSSTRKIAYGNRDLNPVLSRAFRPQEVFHPVSWRCQGTRRSGSCCRIVHQIPIFKPTRSPTPYMTPAPRPDQDAIGQGPSSHRTADSAWQTIYSAVRMVIDITKEPSDVLLPPKVVVGAVKRLTFRKPSSNS